MQSTALNCAARNGQRQSDMLGYYVTRWKEGAIRYNGAMRLVFNTTIG